MQLVSSRTLDDLRPALQDPDATGPDPVYQVFSLDDPKWANQTEIAFGKIGQEYPKTFGHYHGKAIEETYQVVSGKGIFLLQSKFFENNKWIEDKVSEVILITATAGDEIIITPEWGHSWSNVDDTPLITHDNWRAGHSPTDYDVMTRLHGMAYYLVELGDQPTPVANPQYRDLPQPRWMSAVEFQNYQK